MLDFTSALYLGFEHASRDLPAWSRLTLGKPAVLEEVEGAAQIERDLAGLVGCEAAVLGTSSLHLFWDLFGMLACGSDIFLDEGSYPVARWGVERARMAGALVRCFRTYDIAALRAAVRVAPPRRPVVVTDGFSPMSGRAAPLADYVDFAEKRGGLVVVDDTQALGIFGNSPESNPPYGDSGGGSLLRLARRRGSVVVISSLAKALGVPLAMLGGTAPFVAAFRERSETRVHCSPPSAAALAAARKAIDDNARIGDWLRGRLARRVARFRKGLRKLGLIAVRGNFPVQPLRLPEGIGAESFYEALLERGIQALLQRGSANDTPRISFIVNARHRMSEIDCALQVISCALRETYTFTE